MRGAGQAISWELCWRHRFGFIVLAVYLAAFAAIKVWVLAPEARLRFNPPNELTAFLIVPAVIAFFYFVGVFTYGLSGDLAARESTFPKRMLALPVKTSEPEK